MELWENVFEEEKNSDNKFESLERRVEILENFVQSLQGNMKFMEKEFERISKKKK